MSLRPVLAALVGANLRPLPPAKVPQAIWALALGTLSYAALLTLAIETRADSATIVDGLKIGALVGFLMWFGADFIIYRVRRPNNSPGW